MRLKFNYWRFTSIATFLLIVVISESQQFDCPDKFGHYPDSGDCSKYYVCDHGKSLEANCDDGLFYNPQLKTCDWPRNVECDSDSGGDRVQSLANRDIKKNSFKRQKSHPISSAQQTNQLNPQNDDEYDSQPIPDPNFDHKFDDPPQIEPDFTPDFTPITPSYRPTPPPRSPPPPPRSPPPPPRSPPQRLIKEAPPVKPNFSVFKPDFSEPPPRTPTSRPLPPAPKREEPSSERRSDNIARNPDYDYEPEADYDYEQPLHDSQKSPKEETPPQNSVETTSKGPPVKRMGWLPHDQDNSDMDQYHWSVDDAVNFAQNKPRIPDEAYVKMKDFNNVAKLMDEDDSPNIGEPITDEDYYEDTPEDEEYHPPPPPPPKGNGYVKFNYDDNRPPKEVRYDDDDEEEESPPLPRAPVRDPGRPPVRDPGRPPARAPAQNSGRGPDRDVSRGPAQNTGRGPVRAPPRAPVRDPGGAPAPLHSDNESHEPRNYRYDSREHGPPPPPSEPTTGSRITGTLLKSVPKSSAPKPKPKPKPKPIVNNRQKQNNSQYQRPIQNSEQNNDKLKGKLINSSPRSKPIQSRPTGNQSRHRVVNAVQSVTPSVYQLLKDYQKKLPKTILRQRNFAEEFRDSIIDNYMNNNKPNYILNDRDLNDRQNEYKPPVINGEEDNVRDFDKDIEAINVSINRKNVKQSKQNSNRNTVKVNATEDLSGFRDQAIHRYMNTDAIVKQQRAQDTISSLSTVLPPEREKTTKTPTINIVINHERTDYKPPMKRPPQNAYEVKPLISSTTTTTPAPKPRIHINTQKVHPKPEPKHVYEDEPQVYRKPKETPPRIHDQQAQQSGYSRALRCSPDYCTTPDCRCGGADIPGGFQTKQIPQIVMLTFDDSVNDLNWDIYEDLFNSGRHNPNGCPISGTFYVSHEWTDYAQVQSLYARGHEMASHSITHSFGEKFSKETWAKEIAGQRELLHLYGGVKLEDVRGMRAPFLQTGGDTMFEMLYEANFTYDSSLPVYDINPPYYPYTLDYAINHECMITPCPKKSFPGFWEVGMVMWEDLRGGRCSMADACFNPKDEDGVYEMVKNNFDRHYKTNRSPFGIYFHSRWFLTDHNKKGFMKFLDDVNGMKDVFFVTNWQMIQWMRNPTPLSQINDFKPWKCDFSDRPQECDRPYECKVKLKGELRVLKTCQSCPKVYPWRGNNGLKSKA